MDLSELILLCRQNDKKAQKALYDRFAMQMFIVCRRYLPLREAAEEVVMNGFLKIFQNIKTFDYHGESSLVAWIKKIMVNECLMELRKQHSFLQLPGDELPDSVCADDALDRITIEEIHSLVILLPIGYRTVFNMHAMENYSHAEIANHLGISEGTSKSQFHKARKQLQQMVNAQNTYYALQQTK